MFCSIGLFLFEVNSVICPTDAGLTATYYSQIRFIMEQETPDRRKRGYSLRRSIMDYGMGAVIGGLGVFFLVSPKLGLQYPLLEGFYRYAMGGLFILYGGFRAYRGYKKNYFD